MTNPHVAATARSPISEAYGWLDSTPLPKDLDLIDVAQAVPGYPPPAGLVDHLREADQTVLSKYGPVLGQPELRTALAKNISSAYAADVQSDQVAITSGANQAFCLSVTALCQPGDEVILPVPNYFNHNMWLRMNGVGTIHLPSGKDMLPDVAAAAELITERTRAIALVTPNNPTGRVYPPELIASFARLASSNGVYLILDETYREFRQTTEPAHTLFEDPCWDESLIHLHSFSKMFSITGYRVGALAAAVDVLVEIDKIADCMTICPNRLGQEAALYGLEHLGDWVDSNRQLMNRRVDEFVRLMDETDSPYKVVSAGAYFAYVRHPFEGEAGTNVARRLLEDQSVLALAGEMFGNDQHAYLRLAFANLDDGRIPDLVDRLGQSGE